MKIFYLIILIFAASILSFSTTYYSVSLGVANDFGSLNSKTLTPIFRPVSDFNFTKQSNIIPYLNLGFKFNLNSDLFIGLMFEGQKRNYLSNTNELIPIAVNGKPGIAIVNDKVELSNLLLSSGLSISHRIIDKLFANVNFSGFFQNTNFTFIQTPIYPTDFKFNLPFENKSGNIENINNILFSIGGGIEYKFSLSRNLTLNPKLNYNYIVTPLLTEVGSSWKSSYLGFTLGIEYSNRARKFNSDTLILRDTIVKVENIDKITLISTDFNTDSKEDDETILQSVTRTEKYIHTIPQPVSLLTGEIKAKFIDDTGKEYEEQKLKVSQFVNAKYVLKESFNKKAFNKSDYFDKTDTLLKAEIPKLKFTIDYIAEAGLKDWKINIFNSYGNFKEFVGDEDKEKTIIWDIAKEIELKNLMSQKYNFTLNLTDNDKNTKIVSKGTFAFQFELDNKKNKDIDKKQYILNIAKFKDGNELLKYTHLLLQSEFILKSKQQKVKFTLPDNLKQIFTEYLEKQIKKDFVILQNPSENLIIEIE